MKGILSKKKKELLTFTIRIRRLKKGLILFSLYTAPILCVLFPGLQKFMVSCLKIIFKKKWI